MSNALGTVSQGFTHFLRNVRFAIWPCRYAGFAKTETSFFHIDHVDFRVDPMMKSRNGVAWRRARTSFGDHRRRCQHQPDPVSKRASFDGPVRWTQYKGARRHDHEEQDGYDGQFRIGKVREPLARIRSNVYGRYAK
jgi:hypothetical protein